MQGAVNGRGSGEVKAKFFGAGEVDIPLRGFQRDFTGQIRIEGFRARTKNLQKGAGGSLGGGELNPLGPHDGPAENGPDQEKKDDGFAGKVGMFEGKEKTGTRKHEMDISLSGTSSTADMGIFPFSVKNLGTGDRGELKLNSFPMQGVPLWSGG